MCLPKPNMYLITILGGNGIMDDSNVSLLPLVHHLFNTTKQTCLTLQHYKQLLFIYRTVKIRQIMWDSSEH